MRLVFAAVFLAGCAGSGPTGTAALANSPPIADRRPPAAAGSELERRGIYIGTEIGAEISHFGRVVHGKITLPAGMERLSTTRFASSQVLQTARLGDDLVIFLLDGNGVVTDDITLVGMANRLLIPDCHDEAYLGIGEPRACAGHRTATPLHTIAIEGSLLVEGRGDLTCFCDIVNIDEDIDEAPAQAPGG